MTAHPLSSLAVALALISGCSTITMRISRPDLQADLAARFPVDIDKHVVMVRLSEPALDLPGTRDRLGLRLRIDASTAHSHLGGTVRVEGDLGYVTADHAFYLREPRVPELRLDPVDASSANDGRLARLRAGVGSRVFEDAARLAIEETLRTRPIYRLVATRSEREAKAIRHLRQVHVDGQDLVLEVGL